LRELLVHRAREIDRAHGAALVVHLARDRDRGRALVVVRRRARDEDEDALRVRPPLHLLERGLEAEVQALRPVAAALGADAREEGGELGSARGERSDLDRDVVLAIAVDDEPDARDRHHPADRVDERGEVAPDERDHVAHAGGAVDDEHDVEALLAEAAHVASERAAEGDAEAAAPARAAEAPDDDRAGRALRRDVRARRGRRRRQRDRLRGGDRQVADERDRGRRRRREVGDRGEPVLDAAAPRPGGLGAHVLQREDLALVPLPEAHPAALADPEARAAADAEPAAGADDVEPEEKAEDGVKRCRQEERGDEAGAAHREGFATAARVRSGGSREAVAVRPVQVKTGPSESQAGPGDRLVRAPNRPSRAPAPTPPAASETGSPRRLSGAGSGERASP